VIVQHLAAIEPRLTRAKVSTLVRLSIFEISGVAKPNLAMRFHIAECKVDATRISFSDMILFLSSRK